MLWAQMPTHPNSLEGWNNVNLYSNSTLSKQLINLSSWHWDSRNIVTQFVDGIQTTLNYRMIVERYPNREEWFDSRPPNRLSTWQKTSQVVKHLMCSKKGKQRKKSNLVNTTHLYVNLNFRTHFCETKLFSSKFPLLYDYDTWWCGI